MKAYILVDAQNDFVSGSLGSCQNSQIVDKIKEYLQKENPKDVIATLDTHFHDYLTTLEGKNLPIPHCIAGTDGHKIDNRLKSFVTRKVSKGTFMANEDLINEVISVYKDFNDNQEENDEIIVFGFVTSICVINNALKLRAEFPNTKITLIENLCGDINEESHKAALLVMKNCQINVETFEL